MKRSWKVLIVQHILDEKKGYFEKFQIEKWSCFSFMLLKDLGWWKAEGKPQEDRGVVD